ncbi:MAG: L-ribulose-5-phosphate 4-epimerase [Bacteroidota bacterium]|jgi:L-ribulose-5-phosphate 4-epimerase
MTTFSDLKQACFDANVQLNRSGLVRFTFGNASVSDPAAAVFAIKPSGVPYNLLRPADMVVVDFEGRVVDGSLRPSSDTPTHAWLYREWSRIGGVVHTHATYSVAWAQAQRDIPVLGTTHADYLPCDVPCTPPMPDERVSGDYEHQTGVHITECFRLRGLSPELVPMVLVGSHGPFTWGETPQLAIHHAEALEEIARMAFLTLQINPSTSRLQPALLRKHHQRKHGTDAYYGQP